MAEQEAPLPKWLECWQSKEEKEEPEKRPRWMGRLTFIIAAIGSAIGLGNFWRFPYLTYKHGGSAFFFPWATCLFVLGIPFMIMELALGQKFQRGDIAVFRGINKRLAGIGYVSVYSSYVFSFYYNVVVAWALIYVIVAFMNPLPWAESIDPSEFACPEGDISRAQQFFQINVIRIVDPDNNCQWWQDGDGTQFSWTALGSTLVVWIVIYFCIFKGVKSSSYLVWITVPVPVIFVFIMIWKGYSLPGSENGLTKYFAGNDENPTTSAEQWSDASGQIFLGLSVCLGIMTSYGSYNPVDKPIIMDSFIISISNCSFSFIAGFAVWAVVGYLEHLGKLDRSNQSGVALAFYTYPTAIDQMEMQNLWAFILGSTLFMLGIDSSFSAIEATSTVICDTTWGKRAPRMFVAFVLCVIGFIGSVPFCCNWGFIIFDVVDHYLCAYLLNLIGILQAFGCGWFFDLEKTMSKSEEHAKSLKILSFMYWVPLLLVSIITTWMEAQSIGFAVFAVVFILGGIVPAFMVSKVSFNEFYEDILMCGVRKIAYSCSQMGRKEPTEKMWWEPIFVFYWGFLTKFVNPCILTFILWGILKNDFEKAYGGYEDYFQVVGWLIPIVGLLLFIIPIFACQQNEELTYDEFELAELKAEVNTSAVKPAEEDQTGGAPAEIPAEDAKPAEDKPAEE